MAVSLRQDYPFAYRLFWSGKPRIIFGLFSFVLVLYAIFFILPIRNMVLAPCIEYAWREVETSDLLRLRNAGQEIPDGLFDVVICDAIRIPRVVKEDINTSDMLTYPQFDNWNLTLEVMMNKHGRYLPALNSTLKRDHLYLYLVLVEALDSVGIQHFLVAGSLLGLSRHGGFVPWDDDLDISVSIATWQLLKQTLSCVEGFALRKESEFHWKFHYLGAEYPFVDIFFYEMDEFYVWALTHYTRITYIYPTRYVFPLREAVFEGLKVPVPWDGLSIARRIYDFDLCKAFRSHVDMRNKTLEEMYPDSFSVASVECQELSYMYNLHNLGGS